MDVPFRKMKNKRCPVWGIKEFSARYLGTEGFAQARRDCAADDTCKAIIDVSETFHLGRGKQFLLCTSDEWVGSLGQNDIYIKGDF